MISCPFLPIFTALAPTEYATPLAIAIALTILFNTFGFLTLTSLFDLLQVHPQLKAIIELLLLGIILLIKRLGIPRQCLYDGLLLLLGLLHISAALTAAILTAEDFQVEAFAVHFEAVGFTAVAASRGKYRSRLLFEKFVLFPGRAHGVPFGLGFRGGWRGLDLHRGGGVGGWGLGVLSLGRGVGGRLSGLWLLVTLFPAEVAVIGPLVCIITLLEISLDGVCGAVPPIGHLLLTRRSNQLSILTGILQAPGTILLNDLIVLVMDVDINFGLLDHPLQQVLLRLINPHELPVL